MDALSDVTKYLAGRLVDMHARRHDRCTARTRQRRAAPPMLRFLFAVRALSIVSSCNELSVLDGFSDTSLLS